MEKSHDRKEVKHILPIKLFNIFVFFFKFNILLVVIFIALPLNQGVEVNYKI